MNPTETYWKKQVKRTRRYGYTYVHVGMKNPHASYTGADGTVYSYSSYGRSLIAGGHKYKVHARREGKPVPTAWLV